MSSSDTPGFFLVGIGLIVTAILLSLQKIKKIARTKTTRGTVVRSELIVDSDGAKAWHAVVEFVADSAGRAEFISPVGTSSSKWKPGDAVPVRYNPAKPTKAEIDRRLYRFLIPIVLSFLGLVFTSLALYIDFQSTGH